MKLWWCHAWGIDEEWTELNVQPTKEDAERVFQQSLDNAGVWFAGHSIDEVDEINGYKVVFKKGKKISLESK